MSTWMVWLLVVSNVMTWLLTRSTVNSISGRLDIQSARIDTAVEQTEKLRKHLEGVAEIQVMIAKNAVQAARSGSAGGT